MRSLLMLVFDVFYFLLLARIIFSFLQLGRDTHPALLKLRKFVYALTEPLIAPLRDIVRPVRLGSGSYMDMSPLVAMLMLWLARGIVMRFF